MQEHNAHIVLEFVKQHGPVSRADTARSLGFSKSAISNLISVLLKDELLEVVGTGHPATGRKSQLLSFNPNAFFNVGVELLWGQVRCALVNLNGRIVNEHTEVVSDTTDAAEVVNSVEKSVRLVAENSGQTHDRVAGVGIMVPGIVDAAEGRVVYSSVLGWNEPVNLASMLEDRLSTPVFLENDANALALAEVWVGRGGQFSHIALLFLSDGVGGAFFSKSEVLRGRNYAGGMEVGKMIVCGRDGPASVESHLSARTLEDLFGLEHGPKVDNVEALFERVREQVLADPESVRPAFQEIVDLLAQVIANVVALVNPDAVFLDTPLLQAYDNFIRELEESVGQYLPRRPELTVRIYPASLPTEREVVGGAAIAMYRTRFRFIITGKNSTEAEWAEAESVAAFDDRISES